MNETRQFQLLFVGQSKSVAATIQSLVQVHAQSILASKSKAHLPFLNFASTTSQRMALQLIRQTAPDVILMETGLANGNRKKFCEAIRNRQPIVRLIEVAHKQSEGADAFDGFLKLPVEPKQMVDVLQHSIKPVTSHLLPFGKFIFDSANNVLNCPDGKKQLRPMESKLLAYLLENRNQVVGRADIMNKVWGTDFVDDTRTLAVHIRHLREQIEENPSAPEYLITERGLGYLLKL